jgi:hypothetical protein
VDRVTSDGTTRLEEDGNMKLLLDRRYIIFVQINKDVFIVKAIV